MKRILVIRIDFLGDMICTTAFLRELKKHWPDAEIHVLANRSNKAALDGNPDVSAVHTYVYSKDSKPNLRPGKLNPLFGPLSLVLRFRRLQSHSLILTNSS